MPDREKIIKGLELCTNISPDGCLMLCPYKDEKDETYSGFCEQVLKRDALTLLKEQEGKQVIKQTYHVMMNRDYESPVVVTRYDWLCPTCKSLLCRDIDVIDDNYHFCKVCGQAVKWK